MPHRFEEIGDPLQAGSGASQTAVAAFAALESLPKPEGMCVWMFLVGFFLLVIEYIVTTIKASKFCKQYGVGVGHAHSD